MASELMPTDCPCEQDAALGARGKLDFLLRPRSIALVGASTRQGSFGLRLLNAVRGDRYTGHIFPVNPRYGDIDGLPCYPSLDELPEVPDLVAFAVADEQIEVLLSQAADLGVRAAAMFGRGYEPHHEGPPLSERLGHIARRAGMAVCGNNCMGFVNIVDGLRVSGNPPPIPDKPGTIGLVSHSGSTWSGLVGSQRQLIFNYAVSAGQEIATTMADYVDFLLDQSETRVIGCIMETVRDPAAFLAAAERADRQGVPIVVLKLGRSEQGRRFALAHSGALTGSDSVYQAVFQRHNIVRVFTADELADTLEILNAARRPKGGGIGIVTDSGGERELIVDIAADVGAPLAVLTPESSHRLSKVLDPGMSPLNPVDSYGDGRMLIEDCMSVLADDDDVGIVALATNLVAGRPYAEAATGVVERVHAATAKPVLLFGNLHSTVSREHAAKLRGQGIPVLMGTPTALSAMKHAIAWQAGRERGGSQSDLIDDNLPELQRITRLVEEDGPGPMSPQATAQLMELCSLSRAPSLFVTSPDEAVGAATQLGFPVVLKTANPDILHKTERGGVVLGLADPTAVAAAYCALAERCGPQVEVQAQITGDVELLVGMTADPQFGPVITIGLGGVLTELLGDTVTFFPPVDTATVHRNLKSLKGYRLLTGYRGSASADIGAVVRLIVRFSAFCAAFGKMFSEIDLNPVKVSPTGAVAVDALFIPTGTASCHDWNNQ